MSADGEMGSSPFKGSKKSEEKKPEQFLLQVAVNGGDGITCTALSEDRSLISTGFESGKVLLWSSLSIQTECIGDLIGHTVSGYLKNHVIIC